MAELKAHALSLIQSQPLISNIGMASMQAQALEAAHQEMVSMASAQAQAMMALQALTQPLVPNNPWEAMSPNLMGIHNSLLGVPEPMLNVPDIINIPDNIVGVPEILGIQPKLFTTSSPIPQIMPNIPRHPTPHVFSPDDFEPPRFSAVTKKAEASKQCSIRENLSPPPGVDFEEYLRDHQDDIGLKRKIDQINNESSKKQKTSSNGNTTSVPNTSESNKSNVQEKKEVEADGSTKRKAESEPENNVDVKKSCITEKESKDKQSEKSETPLVSEPPKQKIYKPTDGDIMDEEDEKMFKHILQQLYKEFYGSLDETKCQRTLNGLAKRLSLFRHHLLYNVAVNLNIIDINVTNLQGSPKENQPKHLLLVSRVMIYIMTHEIFRKDCCPKTRMLHCLGFLHTNYADKRRLFGVCKKMADEFPELVRQTRQVLTKHLSVDQTRLDAKSNADDKAKAKTDLNSEKVKSDTGNKSLPGTKSDSENQVITEAQSNEINLDDTIDVIEQSAQNTPSSSGRLNCPRLLAYLQEHPDCERIFMDMIKKVADLKDEDNSPRLIHLSNKLTFYIRNYLVPNPVTPPSTSENEKDVGEKSTNKRYETFPTKLSVVGYLSINKYARGIAHVITHELFENSKCPKQIKRQRGFRRYNLHNFFVLIDNCLFERKGLCTDRTYAPLHEKLLLKIRKALKSVNREAFPEDYLDNDDDDDIEENSQQKLVQEVDENSEGIVCLKKYIYEVLWKMLLKTSFKPQPLLLDNQRVVLVKLTENAANYLYSVQNNTEGSVQPFDVFPKIKQLGLIKNLFKALIYVIKHDIFRKPPCRDHMCLKQPKKSCSPLQLPEELKIARVTVASVEKKLFKRLRSEKKLPDSQSLIAELDMKSLKNMFPIEETSEELHRDMFEEDILQYIFGHNSLHFYWKVVTQILRATYNRKLKPIFYTKTLPFLLQAIDKYIRTVGNAPGADAIVLKDTEKEHLTVENEPDRILKEVIVSIMHVITHEIVEQSKCNNIAHINEGNIPIEDFNRSNICRNPVYHYPDIELLKSIRTHFIVAYRGDPVFLPPYAVPYSEPLPAWLELP